MTARQSIFMVIIAALALSRAATVAADDENSRSPRQKFPATGQTICYDSAGNVIACAGTGQDGDIQAGAMLRYRDNGDGTVTDKNTRLVWEKKSADGSIHDVNTGYTWEDAFAVHVAALNNSCKNDETVACTTNADCAGPGDRCGFAGKRDWRLPNYKELTSILNLENFGPAVSAVFNTNCVPNATVLDGSCTEALSNSYWSSTTFASFPAFAWIVEFFTGFSSLDGKDSIGPHVRAVRGGSL